MRGGGSTNPVAQITRLSSTYVWVVYKFRWKGATISLPDINVDDDQQARYN